MRRSANIELGRIELYNIGNLAYFCRVKMKLPHRSNLSVNFGATGREFFAKPQELAVLGASYFALWKPTVWSWQDYFSGRPQYQRCRTSDKAVHVPESEKRDCELPSG